MNHLPRPTRRDIFRSTAGAAGAAAALPSWFARELLAQGAPKPPTNSDDLPAIALVGCGGRGRGVAAEAQRFGRVVAVCDVDTGHSEGASVGLSQSQRETDAKFGRKTPLGEIRRYDDFRKLIDTEKDVSVIVNGTPDHWHTLVNLYALRRSKDVYSEKPLTLTIDEGKRVVVAVRETKRVLQTGTQQRSDPQFRLVCELVQNGRVGKLKKVTTIVPAGLRAGPFQPKPIPKTLNWDMWLGQAPMVDYVPERTHTMFRFWYDYSGGTITDWGAHHNDIALWGMGMDGSGPTSVEGKQLVEQIPGGYTAASQYEVKYTYANGVEHTCKTTTADNFFGGKQRETEPGERRNGVLFEGSDGWLFVSRGVAEASDPAILKDPLPSGAKRLYASNNHMANFFECVKSRKAPAANADIGHRSISVCHLGSIALRLGRKLQWDPEKEMFVGDNEADRYVAREQRKPWSYEVVNV